MLLKMSQQHLDALFSAHDAGPIPEARKPQSSLPGTSFSETIASSSTSSHDRARCSTRRRGYCETTFCRSG
jgi:hypothetical protein